MKQKSTIKDLATIKGEIYNCQIEGDGKVKKYGVDLPGRKDCEYFINCIKLGVA